ncbi:MAG: asparaginase [Pseudomonadota bacterium]
MNPVPLFTLVRNGFPEIQISGEICVWDGSRILFQASEVNSRYPVRSLLKPFQFLATGLLEAGAREEWHVAALGSISATPEQVDQLKQWTSKPPFLDLLGSLQLSASHACFAKHLSILQASKMKGWSVDGYLSRSHPYHQSLVKNLAHILAEPAETFEFVVDGCKLPSPVLRMEQMGRLFQSLAKAEKLSQLQIIRDLMMASPDWIGGPHRVDSGLMKSNHQRLIAKEGADGLLALGILPNSKFKDGLGIVVKLASGYQPQFAALAIRPLLEWLGLHCENEAPEGQTLLYHYEPGERTTRSWIDVSPTLNSKTAVWPGDENFSRQVSLDVDKNDHLSLSAIKTTLHIGAHTDSPGHFGKGGKGIDAVELWKYQGTCQVIEVKKLPHTEILPEDIEAVKIVSPRVLFKTGSFPDGARFNQDFVACSARLIETLAAEQVVLVGIDTPSIDLFESKELASHKATLLSEMAILEGIDLTHVEPGIYELVAFPLKIESGDASPVRALLLRK